MNRDSAKFQLHHPERFRLRTALAAKNRSAQQAVIEQLEELERLYQTLVRCLDEKREARQAVSSGATILSGDESQSVRHLRQRVRYAESCLKLADFLAKEIEQLIRDKDLTQRSTRVLQGELDELRVAERLISDEEREHRAAKRMLADIHEQNEKEERHTVGNDE